jgi:Bifunctional DNA primase/polymerase, N-terminal/Primase C terminal 1 (PriCT-1)
VTLRPISHSPVQAIHAQSAGVEMDTPSGPFGDTALHLWQIGLAPIPCGGNDGKTPLVKWRSWSIRPSESRMREFVKRHAARDIGILTEFSNVTVVDCDAQGIDATMIERCGDTPLKIRTPSGGVHLWYRSNGERSRNLRRSHGWPVDIKGLRGFIVVPPSRRRHGPHAGRSYAFIDGTWDNLAQLPQIRAGALTESTRFAPLRGHGQVREGERNEQLFRMLLREVRHSDNLDALLDDARTINETFLPPLDDTEIVRIVGSVWRFQAEGRNWVGAEQHIQITRTEMELLGNNANALALYLVLRFSHERFGAPFGISARAMANHQIIPGWGHSRYRSARNGLLDLGILRQVRTGGRGAGDLPLYEFARLPRPMGPATGPNLT